MTSPESFNLAQFNTARMRAPLEAPLMEGFRNQLDAINALADEAPGFVWRLEGDGGDATDIQAYSDPRILINLSVWQSIDALSRFAYRSDHRFLLKQRGDWFEPSEKASLVLWWIPAGHVPSVEEAVDRLEQLNANGPTQAAFTFREAFEPPAT